MNRWAVFIRRLRRLLRQSDHQRATRVFWLTAGLESCELPSLTLGLPTQVSLCYCEPMHAPPPRPAFTSKEWRLIQHLQTPAQVQAWLTSMPYNWERTGGTMRSFREVVKRHQAHCLEACVSAAVILEQHGYQPLLLDIESWDLLDHVIFVFQKRGLWGSIARSRDI